MTGLGHRVTFAFGWGKPQGGSAYLPSNLSLPTIAGIAQQSQTLTASPGTWNGAPSFSYQWNRAGVRIPGANAATYVVAAADVGSVLSVTVTGANSAGPVEATSLPTAVIIPVNPLPFSLTGTASTAQWGVAYSDTHLVASSGLLPFSVTGGLPAGMTGSFSGGNLTLSGTPV